MAARAEQDQPVNSGKRSVQARNARRIGWTGKSHVLAWRCHGRAACPAPSLQALKTCLKDWFVGSEALGFRPSKASLRDAHGRTMISSYGISGKGAEDCPGQSSVRPSRQHWHSVMETCVQDSASPSPDIRASNVAAMVPRRMVDGHLIMSRRDSSIDCAMGKGIWFDFGYSRLRKLGQEALSPVRRTNPPAS